MRAELTDSRGPVVGLVCCLASLGCTAGEPTQIFLTVDSDLVVSTQATRRELDTIRVRVHRLHDGNDAPLVLREVRGDRPAELEPGELVRIDDYVYENRWSHDFAMGDGVLPLEIGVAPYERDLERVAYFEALALRDGRVVTRTALRTGFVGRRSLRAVLWLTAACLDVVCPPEQVCRGGRCAPVDVAAECLPSSSADAGMGPSECARDGGIDAGPPIDADASAPIDADAPQPDAGTECVPPCGPGSVCVDGTCRSTVTDVDRDGVEAAGDCDDMDPSVGAMAARACSSVCGTGMEICTDGVWAACNAPTMCACPAGTPPRVVSCGNCGQQTQICSGGAWVNDGGCLNQGCAPGTTQSETRGCTCGGSESRTRTCTASCTWGGWSGWSGCAGGECSPGATDSRTVSCGACGAGTLTETRSCGSDCRWGGWGGGTCVGEECAPGTCTCSGCPIYNWRCCNPATCRWFSCGPQVECR